MPFVQVKSKILFYSDTHPASTSASPPKTTLLLIHGLGSSNSYYAPIIPHLVPLGVRCLAIDTCGSGLSKYNGGGQSVQSIVKDAIGVLETLQIPVEKLIVVGHSMGGMVASELASEYPVLGVVLIGPVHPTAAAADVFAKRIAIVEKDGLEPLANSIPTAATGSKSTPLHHAFIRALLLANTAEGYISLCDVIASSKPPRYSEVTCPVLLIAGMEDKSAPMEGCQTILNGYGTITAHKTLVTLEGVGHWHCIEAAEEVENSIAQFVNKWKLI